MVFNSTVIHVFMFRFAIVSKQINSKSACYPYWPEDLYGSQKTFDLFEVETVSVRITSSYKVRKLSLKHTSSKQRRIICHLHFTDWPDHGVPQDPKNFLGEFISCTPLCCTILDSPFVLFIGTTN